MGYISFYRKWRPRTFDEIVGQKYNVQTLKNMLDGKRLSHSYMFCGPRGTGKTSTARILAKAINCEHGITSSPCNKCKNCISISDGSNIDVIEIDAASNRGINEIRELREKVKYLPNDLRKKIYIIDEVHMLTTEAFNALLKVLEEPPEHVVFIMATTEPNKVIPTIMSRCQRFDFYPVSLDLIKNRLKEIAKAEKIDISDSALGLVAKYSDGSLRDADGILEQLAAYSESKIEPSEVVALLGVVDLDILFEFVDILAGRDLKKGLEITEKIIKENQDLKNFTQELIDHLYSLYVVMNYDKPTEIIDLSQDYLGKYKEQAEKLRKEELDYYLDHFTELLRQVKWGESSRTFFKSSVIQALNFIVLDDRQLEKKAKSWDARLDAIERKVNGHPAGLVKDEPAVPEKDLDIINGGPVDDPGAGKTRGIVREEDAVMEIDEKSKKPSAGKQEKKKVQKKGKGSISSIEGEMDNILAVLKKKKISVYAMFIEAGPGRVEGDTIYFYLEENKKWHKDHLNKTANSVVISEAIKEVTGKKYQVKFEAGDVSAKNGRSAEPPADVEEGPAPVKEPGRGKEKITPVEEQEKNTGDSNTENIEEKTGKQQEQADHPDEGLQARQAKEVPPAGEEDIMKYFEKKFEIKE